jgi:hypothetical protein
MALPEHSRPKSLFAGKVEAAGIEPASQSRPNVPLSSSFSASVWVANHEIKIRNGRLWVDHVHESAATAIPKLEAILAAARIATSTQEVPDGTA